MKKIESYDEIIQDLLDHGIIKSKDEIVIEPEKLLEDKEYGREPSIIYCLDQTNRYFMYEVARSIYPVDYKNFLESEIFNNLTKLFGTDFEIAEEIIETGEVMEIGEDYKYIVRVKFNEITVTQKMMHYGSYLDDEGVEELLSAVLKIISPNEIVYEASEAFFIATEESIKFLENKYINTFYA